MSTIKLKEDKSKEDKSKKDKSKKDKKAEEKVPNSLIIYVKTRIPNYYKINYEPFMTVPKTKSGTVYFDPLVKYYEGPVKSIPSNAPKDSIYTQFFEASEFDTMINRTLSDFRYMQKPKTLQQSVDQNIIKNNLKITLKTLFKPNNLFYINNKPYSIVGSHWKDSDWEIDKKPIDKLLTQFSNLTPKELELEAKKEEDDIPEVLRQGNLASSNLKNDEIVTSVAAGLQKTVDNTSSSIGEREQIGETDAFVHQDNLPGVSKDLTRLFSEYLRQNIPINYSDNPDLARDPLTLSLLVEPAELLKFINQNKKNSIVDLYSTYITTKTDLQTADKEYINACTELAIYKTKFDLDVKSVRTTIDSTLPISKENKKKIIQQITDLKINYMKIIFRIADAIMEIYKQQHIYFVSTKLLLEGLKTDYVNIIKYYEKPALAIKCIEYDISTINSLIVEDPNNEYSKSYFINYNKFKLFYEDELYAKENELLTPKINYQDEEYYFNDKGFLLIEKQQYELYNFKMFLFYAYNQFDIWVILFKSIQTFTHFVGTEAIQLLQNSEEISQNYKSYYSEQQQTAFTEKMQSDGIRASYDSKQKRVNWYLVKNDGTRCIEPVIKTSKNTTISRENIENEIQEKIYISSIKSQVHAYDAIVLYIHLLEVVCLRQNRVYVSEENVNQLNLEMSLTLNEYYYTIERSIDEAQQKGLDARIPTSLLWDASKFNDKTAIKNKKNINDKSAIVYRGRLKAIQKSRQEMITNCEAIADIITPNLSKSGFVSKCQSLLAYNLNDINNHSFRSSYWLDKTIKNYNNEATSDFIYNMNNVVKDAWYDRIILDREPEYYLDWMVYNNSGTNTNETIYAAISDALNGQLDLNGDDTENPYTEEIKGKKRFTVSSLTNLVNSVNNDPTILPTDIINILQEVLKIKFVIFEMFTRKNNEIQLGDIVEYEDEKYRVVNILEELSEKAYTLYNGYDLKREIPGSEVKLTKTNLYSNFRIDCNSSQEILSTEIIYLVLSKQTDDNILKYRLVKNSSENNYIHTSDIIPSYITYLIYNNCARFTVDKIAPSFGSFANDFNKFTEIIDKKIETEHIKTERKNINRDLYNKKKEYKQLKLLTDKTQDQKTRQTILKGDIADLIERQNQIEKLYKNSNDVRGGGPRDQYVNSSSPYYNPLGYPMNPNMQTSTVYLPRGYQKGYQQGYQPRLPYNVSQNKAKDLKSKLSFYITVELELFPGKTVNALQKSVVRCQSTFERIREAYADIFGFQYRPASMTEAYSYGIKPPRKNGTSRDNTYRNNTSRDNTYRNNTSRNNTYRNNKQRYKSTNNSTYKNRK